jgi:hypothetical protein
MAKEMKSAEELAAMIIAGLKAEGVPAASIEVYRIDEPSIEMTWTVRPQVAARKRERGEG